MVSQKPCIACKAVLPLAEFYTHKRMADGHLNKCKSCCKAYARTKKNHAYDRARSMLPHRVEARAKYLKTERGKAVSQAAKQRWIEKNPIKRVAQNKVNNAVRDGKLIKPKSCGCGSTGYIHGHHDDYTKPLEVKWLCTACHRQRHKELDLERRATGYIKC